MNIIKRTPLPYQALSKTIGLGRPFATQFGLALLLGPIVYLLVRRIMASFDPFILVAYRVPLVYGSAAILLIAALALQRRLFFPDIQVRGTIDRRHLVLGTTAISVAYLATYAYAWIAEQPREYSMVSLFAGLTIAQTLLLCVSLLVLPPIVEELLYRHFLLSAVPYRASSWVAIIAVAGTALIFMIAHRNYVFTSTKVLMFTVGVIFGAARVVSNGLLLPIGLHAYAVALGLTCNAVVSHLERSI